jgi:hypothetical protein
MSRNDDDILRVLEGRQFRQIRYAYDVDGDVEYIGKHRSFGAGTDDVRWEVTKMTYDVSKNVTLAEHTTGSWDNRASLGWA